jgi:hypothetical protein
MLASLFADYVGEGRSFWLFHSPFLSKLRNAVVIVCDPKHYSLGFGVNHISSDRACFLGSKTPKLWIVRLGH